MIAAFDDDAVMAGKALGGVGEDGGVVIARLGGERTVGLDDGEAEQGAVAEAEAGFGRAQRLLRAGGKRTLGCLKG